MTVALITSSLKVSVSDFSFSYFRGPTSYLNEFKALLLSTYVDTYQQQPPNFLESIDDQRAT